MRLYWRLFQTAINQYMAYRLSFVLWRFRVVLNVLIVYFLWWSVYANRSEIFGYTKTEMITYVLLTNIAGTIIFASRTTDIAGEILDGTVMNYLTKPVSTMRIFLTREVADKLLNAIFSVLEVGVLVALLHPSVVVQTDFLALLFFFLALCLGAVMAYFMSFLLSLLAFWTTEVWAPRFIYYVLISFLAGSYFPLDVLPRTLYHLFLWTPFAYLMYLPSKIYLHGINADTLMLFIPALVWTGIFYCAVQVVWNKGLKEFSFYGR